MGDSPSMPDPPPPPPPPPPDDGARLAELAQQRSDLRRRRIGRAALRIEPSTSGGGTGVSIPTTGG